MFSNLVKRYVLGEALPDFPYTLGDRLKSPDSALIWSLHSGTRKDGAKVSIFVFDLKAQAPYAALARNCFKRFKTLRHPTMLRLLDGVETDTHIYIATEEATPLADAVAEVRQTEALVAAGMFNIARGLAFLINDCSLMHGNLSPWAVFVDRAGEWKLGGFEYMSNLQEANCIFLTHGHQNPAVLQCKLPEMAPSPRPAARIANPLWSLDVWMLGCLVYEVFNGPLHGTEQLRAAGRIPENLFPLVRECTHTEPRRRIHPQALLDLGLGPPQGCFATCAMIQAMLFLDTMQIQEQTAKENFFESLYGAALPEDFLKYRILPELVKAIEFGSVSAHVVRPLLKIAGTLKKDDEMRAKFLAAIIKLFQTPDRAVRVRLLESPELYVESLPAKQLNGTLLPALMNGFVDASPVIREMTVKAMLHFAPKLNERSINELLKHLSRTQIDSEPGIRTNTVVCLGKICQYFSDSTRQKVLIPAFSRSLRDPFPHSRSAAVLALTATHEYYPDADCSARILPAMCPLLVDPQAEVRKNAFRACYFFIKRLESLSNEMASKEGLPAKAREPDIGWSSWSAMTSLTRTTSLQLGQVKLVPPVAMEENTLLPAPVAMQTPLGVTATAPRPGETSSRGMVLSSKTGSAPGGWEEALELLEEPMPAAVMPSLLDSDIPPWRTHKGSTRGPAAGQLMLPVEEANLKSSGMPSGSQIGPQRKAAADAWDAVWDDDAWEDSK